MGMLSWGAAMSPCPMTAMEREAYEIQRKIELMSQPHDEEISLSGKEYGDYIDQKYKAVFIELKRAGNNTGIDNLKDKIVNELIRKKAMKKEMDKFLVGMYPKEYAYGSSSAIKEPNEKSLAEIQKIIYEMATKDDTSKLAKKKSLWDKIKDVFD